MNETQSFLTTLLEYPYGWVVLVVLILSALAALIVIAVIAAKGANSSLEKLLEVIGKMSDNRRMELGITDKTVTLLTELVRDRFFVTKVKPKKLPKHKDGSTDKNEGLKSDEKNEKNQSRPAKRND